MPSTIWWHHLSSGVSVKVKSVMGCATFPLPSQPCDFAAMLWGVTCRHPGNQLLSASQEHISPSCIWRWQDFGKALVLVVSCQHEMSFQKMSEMIWLGRAGSSRGAAHGCGPMDCLAQEVEDFSR